MAAPAKKAGTDRSNKSASAFAPSCLIAREKNGKLMVFNLGETADPVLELLDRLRKTKGDSKYTDLLPIIRGKSVRQFHFT